MEEEITIFSGPPNHAPAPAVLDLKVKRETLVGEEEHILIKGCIEWDRHAQNRLYEKYCEKMFALCFRYAKNKEEAEDIFHEAFIKVFENIKNFRYAGSLEGWIRKIMVHTAIDKFKKNSHLFVVMNIDDYTAGENHYYADDVTSQLNVNDLFEMIQRLPPAYRMVFNLYVFEGLKHREIAERLSISEGTSKSNLSNARSILKKKINLSYSYEEKKIKPDGRK